MKLFWFYVVGVPIIVAAIIAANVWSDVQVCKTYFKEVGTLTCLFSAKLRAVPK